MLCSTLSRIEIIISEFKACLSYWIYQPSLFQIFLHFRVLVPLHLKNFGICGDPLALNIRCLQGGGTILGRA